MSTNMRKRVFKLSGVCLGLIMLLAACSFPGMVQTSQQLPRVNQTSAQPTPVPPVRFPQDEGGHNDLTEWWYYTGHLQATNAAGQPHTYGFELVVFQAQRSSLPPVYAAHFAISDVTSGQFHFDQRRLTAPAPVSPGNSTRGMDIHVGNWSIEGLNGQDHLIASIQDYAINLSLSSVKAPVLHNGNGLITDGMGQFSYYYSRTRMQVSGAISDHQHNLAVKGQAWMDHQWGNFLTLGGDGWDWYSIQLNNDTEMMLYFIRDASGKVASTYGEYVDAAGKDHLLNEKLIKSAPLATWTSSLTHATYPSGWRLDITDPQWTGTVTITPQLKDQELVTCQSTGNVYWEGAVNIQGQGNGQAIGGEGYIELNGYPTSICHQEP